MGPQGSPAVFTELKTQRVEFSGPRKLKFARQNIRDRQTALRNGERERVAEQRNTVFLEIVAVSLSLWLRIYLYVHEKSVLRTKGNAGLLHCRHTLYCLNHQGSHWKAAGWISGALSGLGTVCIPISLLGKTDYTRYWGNSLSKSHF